MSALPDELSVATALLSFASALVTAVTVGQAARGSRPSSEPKPAQPEPQPEQEQERGQERTPAHTKDPGATPKDPG
jgi:hypothetical protein